MIASTITPTMNKTIKTTIQYHIAVEPVGGPPPVAAGLSVMAVILAS